jgi:hypothetical protein
MQCRIFCLGFYLTYVADRTGPHSIGILAVSSLDGIVFGFHLLGFVVDRSGISIADVSFLATWTALCSAAQLGLGLVLLRGKPLEQRSDCTEWEYVSQRCSKFFKFEYIIGWAGVASL